MIEPKFGGMILLVIPILSLFAIFIISPVSKRKYSEILFVVTIIFSIFFSFAYANLLTIPVPENEKIHYDDFVGKFFLFFFSNIFIPTFYYLGLLVFYFIFYKRLHKAQK